MAVLLPLWVGCAHTPSAEPTGLKAETFWQEQRDRSTDTRQLSSRIYFRYESKKENVGGQGRLVLQAPDALRMELRDPFGRLQYLVTLHDRRFVARYPRQNLAYLDKLGGAAYLKRVLGLNVSFQELKSLLTGEVPPGWRKPQFDVWRWDGESGAYVGEFHNGSRTVECVVDPQSAALREIRVRDSLPGGEAVIRYSDFSPCCQAENGTGAPLPFAHLVRLEMPQTGSAVSVDWEEIGVFQEPKSPVIFEADLPSETRRVNLN
jgi:hypothetical protein